MKTCIDLINDRLHNMGEEYVKQLISKPNVKTVALVKPTNEIIGVLTYSISACKIFSELVFLVIKCEEQAKGYGGYLINSYYTKLRK
eukprot:UN01947